MYLHKIHFYLTWTALFIDIFFSLFEIYEHATVSVYQMQKQTNSRQLDWNILSEIVSIYRAQTLQTSQTYIINEVNYTEQSPNSSITNLLFCNWKALWN